MSILRHLGSSLIKHHQLYTGYPPFFDLSEAQTILSVIGGNRPERPHFFGAELMPLPLWNLVTKCWDSEPSMRPSADRVVKRLMLAPSQSMNPPLPVRHTTMGEYVNHPRRMSLRGIQINVCFPIARNSLRSARVPESIARLYTRSKRLPCLHPGTRLIL